MIIKNIFKYFITQEVLTIIISRLCLSLKAKKSDSQEKILKEHKVLNVHYH